MPNLMLLFIVPLIGSIITFVFPPTSGRFLKRLALLLSLLPLALLIYGYSGWIGSHVEYDWVPALSIQFYLRIDALTLLFLFLTAIIIPISLFAAKIKETPYPNVFYGLILLLQALLFGFFMARDLALFIIFWESMLLPLYFIINIWGGPRRKAAAIKFLIYMIAGSTLMVAATLFLYFNANGTFSLDALAKVAENVPHAKWIFAIFLLAFAVKTPLFPFHAWLPDAYCEASTSGTILLSALLSKAGIYGILRIGMELFPTILKEWSPYLLPLAIVGVLYAGMCAWMQTDYKRLIAYSSLSHVNFILAGLFAWDQVAHTGAIIQALNHGITITALFLASDWLEGRLGSREIGPVSGLTKFMPHLCWVTLFFVLSSVALPGTNSFIGELLILFGVFQVNPWMAFFLGLTVILSVIYMLRWMQNVYFDEPHFFRDSWVDMKPKEWILATPLIALILWIGIYPAPILNLIKDRTETNIAIAQLEDPL